MSCDKSKTWQDVIDEFREIHKEKIACYTDQKVMVIVALILANIMEKRRMEAAING